MKGLLDVDTKGGILSKVEQMDLDTTVALVEARETGNCDLVQLGGGGTLASKASRTTHHLRSRWTGST